MTKQQIIEILNRGGYICQSDKEQKMAALYDEKDGFIMELPVSIMHTIAKAGDITIWRDSEIWRYSSSVYVGNYLRKKYRDFENLRHCKSIADDCEAYADGYMYKCPECGEEHYIDDDEIPQYKCKCGFVGTLDEYEQQSIYDYFEDALDIEYRVNSAKEFRSVEIMVAWGGPNIYIDTACNKVKLYWGGEYAEYPIINHAADIIDDWAAEYWECL